MVTLPVTFPTKFAVIVPAEKFPLPSRLTKVLLVFALVAWFNSEAIEVILCVLLITLLTRSVTTGAKFVIIAVILLVFAVTLVSNEVILDVAELSVPVKLVILLVAVCKLPVMVVIDPVADCKLFVSVVIEPVAD